MSKAVIIGGIIVVVGSVGGGGYYYVSQQVEHKFQEQIKIIEHANPGSSLTFANHSINVFSQKVTLDKVQYTQKDGTVYNADQVDITLGADHSLSKLSVNALSGHDKENLNQFSAAHVDVDNFKAEPGAWVVKDGHLEKLYPSKIKFDLLNIGQLQATTKDEVLKFGEFQIKDFGVGRKTDIILKQQDIKSTDDTHKYQATLGNFQVYKINLADISKIIETRYQELQSDQTKEAKVKATLNILSQVNFALLNIGDFKLASEPPNDLSMGLKQFQIKDYGTNQLGNITLNQLDIYNVDGKPDNYLKVGSFDSGKILLALTFKNLSQIKWDNLYNFSKQFSDIQVEEMKKLGAMTTSANLSDVAFGFEGNKIDLSKFEVIGTQDTKGDIKANYRLNDLKMNFSDQDRDVKILIDMGYKTLEFSGMMNVIYQKDISQWTYTFDNVAIKDFGALNLTFKMIAPFNFGSENPMTLMLNPNLKFVGFNMNLLSKGIIQRFIDYTAKKRGISVDQVKEGIISEIKLRAEAKSSDVVLQQLCQAAIEIVQDPQKALLININPPSAVPFISMMGANSNQVAKQLDIQIKAQ
ncbi:hypothetical protein [Commensalibacter oyaizuii]|uniref:DUF945 domain-containing protein n=1 Tax=Commensalibacter oyaizuii TaxID=3043873 RepID=A0ABT6Q3Z1_9PROT|nr:hypothetical protein [Commensalibacter sp. TBRC 16381]MDI2091830.1 hypothetical protein [Commensalibacter sp. TBRC 16381]